jgi:hypothetical protein
LEEKLSFASTEGHLHKTVLKVEEILKHIRSGITANPSVDSEKLFVFLWSQIKVFILLYALFVVCLFELFIYLFFFFFFSFFLFILEKY